MTQMTQMTQAEMQSQLIAKAQAEPEFRAQLVADPKAAIGKVVGSEIPEAITIQVHEDSATSFHLVLPPSGELTEDELATVFAGNWATDWWNAGVSDEAQDALD